MDNLETLNGTIENVVYYNESTDYAVLEISDKDGLLVTAVGTLPIPVEGESVIFKGNWVYHKEFGKQFSIESFEKTLPSESEGILQYLSSHVVKGVGPVTARRIVERFGEETFDVIENHPEWLADIQGITLKKAATISESFRSQNGLRGVVMFCKDYMGVSEATKVYKHFGSGAVGIIKDNPYILCEGECGIPFDTADRIAMSLGIEKDNLYRIKSGIEYVLSYNSSVNGHTCLPEDKLISAAMSVLELDSAVIFEAIGVLLGDESLSYYSVDGTRFIMTFETFEKENYIAKRISQMDDNVRRFSDIDIIGLIDRVEIECGISYASLQRQALYESLSRGIMILTGGPGTGKTTVVKALISIFRTLKLKTVLAAPTGRAAKRMSVSSSHEAKTIHRMLEMERSDGQSVVFNRNAGNLLDEDVVIVDEASMIDLSLMYALVSALKRGARLILIGDADQLPSVGAGNILSDLISSGRIKTVFLKEIFRQSTKSLIVTNAHNINNGRMPILSAVDSDFFFVRRDDERSISETISTLITERLPKAYGSSIKNRIQVISPSKKGYGGIEILNNELQSKINPKKKGTKEKLSHGTVFREGDKVMQIVNDYDLEWTSGSKMGLGVYNGDIGVITSIDLEESSLTVDFDDKRVIYSFELLDELELAYAITVHKSQGSEYPVVIIPAYHCAPMLMNRNLLYTAVTRAKEMVVIVGRGDVIERMVNNKREILRFTTLKNRILDYC